MSVKPILFNTEMVRAILDGRKTVTRRLVKPLVPDQCELRKMESGYHAGEWHLYKDNPILDPANRSPWGAQFIPPYQPGDTLYVRETWSTRPSNHCHAQPCHGGQCPYPDCDSANGPCFPDEYIYKASDTLPEYGGKWHPSIHMPKEAARLFLRVTDVRAERLQEITDDGLDKEGIIPSLVLCGEQPSPNAIRAGKRKAFSDLWDSTIKPADRDRYGWAANPWVWVICFERCEKPEEMYAVRLLAASADYEKSRRLVELAEADVKGGLLVAPFKLGATVYRICPKCNDRHNGSCENCAWRGTGGVEGCNVFGLWNDGQYPPEKCTIVPWNATWNRMPLIIQYLGIRIFPTYEEAKAALEKEEHNG